MRLAFYGMGYLGHAYSAWCASLKHDVTAIGKLTDRDKLEPELVDLLEQHNHGRGWRHGGDEIFRIETAEAVWFTFDTPISSKGEADMGFIVREVMNLCDHVHQDIPIFISSQIPVGTIAALEKLVPNHRLAYIPENVRVGRAISYLKYPDRFVLGTRRKSDVPVAEAIINSMSTYRPNPIKIHVMSPESAEFVKHTINAFLGTCISFSNEMSEIAKLVGADPESVYRGIMGEHRIGEKLPLKPGGPFKTGHLERDLLFLENIAQQNGLMIPLLRGISITNNRLKA